MTRKCGYIKDDGEPCRQTVESGTCYWHPDPAADGGEEEYRKAINPGGAPTKYEEERIERILDGARNGLTIEGCARVGGIHFSTLYDWLDDGEDRPLPWSGGEYESFAEAFRTERSHGEMKLVSEVKQRNPQFILERSYDYVKTERREIEADVDASISGDLETEGWEIGYRADSEEDD